VRFDFVNRLLIFFHPRRTSSRRESEVSCDELHYVVVVLGNKTDDMLISGALIPIVDKFLENPSHLPFILKLCFLFIVFQLFGQEQYTTALISQ